MADLVNMLGPLAGAQIPGGCDYCDARQTIEPITAGAWSIGVHRDDWCPWWLSNGNGGTDERAR